MAGKKQHCFFKGIGSGVFYLAPIIARNMIKEKILVIGASGQIGVELTLALRKIYGNANVVASDLREENDLLKGTGPYVSMDVMNKEMLHVQVTVSYTHLTLP